MSIVSLIIAPHLAEGVPHSDQVSQVRKEIKVISKTDSLGNTVTDTVFNVTDTLTR